MYHRLRDRIRFFPHRLIIYKRGRGCGRCRSRDIRPRRSSVSGGRSYVRRLSF